MNVSYSSFSSTPPISYPFTSTLIARNLQLVVHVSTKYFVVQATTLSEIDIKEFVVQIMVTNF